LLISVIPRNHRYGWTTASVIAGVDGVTAVDVREVTDVRATWTDIRVSADVSLVIEADCADEERVAARLREGFGVTGVEALVVGRR
jgi:hypothetical protein